MGSDPISSSALLERHAVAGGADVIGRRITVNRAFTATAVQPLACRAEAVTPVRRFGEVGVGVALVLAGGPRLLRLLARVPQALINGV